MPARHPPPTGPRPASRENWRRITTKVVAALRIARPVSRARIGASPVYKDGLVSVDGDDLNDWFQRAKAINSRKRREHRQHMSGKRAVVRSGHAWERPGMPYLRPIRKALVAGSAERRKARHLQRRRRRRQRRRQQREEGEEEDGVDDDDEEEEQHQRRVEEKDDNARNDETATPTPRAPPVLPSPVPPATFRLLPLAVKPPDSLSALSAKVEDRRRIISRGVRALGTHRRFVLTVDRVQLGGREVGLHFVAFDLADCTSSELRVPWSQLIAFLRALGRHSLARRCLHCVSIPSPEFEVQARAFAAAAFFVHRVEIRPRAAVSSSSSSPPSTSSSSSPFSIRTHELVLPPPQPHTPSDAGRAGGGDDFDACSDAGSAIDEELFAREQCNHGTGALDGSSLDGGGSSLRMSAKSLSRVMASLPARAGVLRTALHPEQIDWNRVQSRIEVRNNSKSPPRQGPGTLDDHAFGDAEDSYVGDKFDDDSGTMSMYESEAFAAQATEEAETEHLQWRLEASDALVLVARFNKSYGPPSLREEEEALRKTQERQGLLATEEAELPAEVEPQQPKEFDSFPSLSAPEVTSSHNPWLANPWEEADDVGVMRVVVGGDGSGAPPALPARPQSRASEERVEAQQQQQTRPLHEQVPELTPLNEGLHGLHRRKEGKRADRRGRGRGRRRRRRRRRHRKGDGVKRSPSPAAAAEEQESATALSPARSASPPRKKFVEHPFYVYATFEEGPLGLALGDCSAKRTRGCMDTSVVVMRVDDNCPHGDKIVGGDVLVRVAGTNITGRALHGRAASPERRKRGKKRRSTSPPTPGSPNAGPRTRGGALPAPFVNVCSMIRSASRPLRLVFRRMMWVEESPLEQQQQHSGGNNSTVLCRPKRSRSPPPMNKSSPARESPTSQLTRESVTAPSPPADLKSPIPNGSVPVETLYFSLASRDRLEELRFLSTRVDLVETEVVKHRVVALDPSASDATLSVVQNALAQCYGNIERLQFTKVDAVVTGDLNSGKDETRALRKRISKRTHRLSKEVETLIEGIKKKRGQGKHMKNKSGAEMFAEARQALAEAGEL